MKGAGARTGELFALAMLTATPACSEKVPVATIWDAGIDAMPMPMTACGALDGGMVGCPDGSFCSSTRGGSTGTCDTVPPEDSCADAGYRAGMRLQWGHLFQRLSTARRRDSRAARNSLLSLRATEAPAA